MWCPCSDIQNRSGLQPVAAEESKQPGNAVAANSKDSSFGNYTFSNAQGVNQAVIQAFEQANMMQYQQQQL